MRCWFWFHQPTTMCSAGVCKRKPANVAEAAGLFPGQRVELGRVRAGKTGGARTGRSIFTTVRAGARGSGVVSLEAGAAAELAGASAFGTLVCGLGVTDALRGFSTNVANCAPPPAPTPSRTRGCSARRHPPRRPPSHSPAAAGCALRPPAADNALGRVACPAEALEAPGAQGIAHYCAYESPDAACCDDDPCGLLGSFNSGPSELASQLVGEWPHPSLCPNPLLLLRGWPRF